MITCERPEIYDEELNKLLVDSAWEMAFDSEGLDLDRETLSKAIERVYNTPEYGYYNLVKLTKEGHWECIGSNLITYEFNISTNRITHWIQSLYVKKEFRRQGVFSKFLLPFNETQLITSKSIGVEVDSKVIKLYMDNHNQTAEAAYYKNGFVKLKQVTIMEEDLKDEVVSSLEYLSKSYSLRQAASEDMETIAQFLKGETYEYLENPGLRDHSGDLVGLANVLKNPFLGKVLILRGEGSSVVCLIYISFEISDWRNNVIWFIYSMKFAPKANEFIDGKGNLTRLVNSICDLNNTVYGGSCSRFVVPIDRVPVFEATRANQSHYSIFEKRLSA